MEKRCSVYVPLGNRDANLRMEELLTKLVKGSDSQDSCFKDIKANILGLSQKVELHTTSIKKLEKQFGLMLDTLHQCQSCTLLRNTIQNPKNDSYCLSITTRNGRDTIDLPLHIDDDVRDDIIKVNNALKAKLRSW